MLFFINIPIPDDTIRILSTLRGSIQMEWNDPVTYHIPLCNIGNITNNHILNEIDLALSQLHLQNFKLILQGVECIKTKADKYILSANLNKPDILLHLKKKIERIIQQHLHSIPKKHFNPHIALTKESYIDQQAIKNWLQTYSLFTIPELHITQFALCSYHKKQNNSYYITESEYNLR